MDKHLTLLALSGVAAVALQVSAGTAHASSTSSRARTTVTIEAQGVDLSGQVTSTRQGCVTDRLVVVFKQVGTRGGGDDIRFATDLASADGAWETGNTGKSGRFYAKVKRTSLCKGDTSPTIRASR